VLQCVAVCCSVLQRAAVCCIDSCYTTHLKTSETQCVAVCCSVLQCVAVCCIDSCYTTHLKMRLEMVIVTNPESWMVEVLGLFWKEPFEKSPVESHSLWIIRLPPPTLSRDLPRTGQPVQTFPERDTPVRTCLERDTPVGFCQNRIKQSGPAQNGTHQSEHIELYQLKTTVFRLWKKNCVPTKNYIQTENIRRGYRGVIDLESVL